MACSTDNLIKNIEDINKSFGVKNNVSNFTANIESTINIGKLYNDKFASLIEQNENNKQAVKDAEMEIAYSKLPSYDEAAKPSMTYAGIGSRRTPKVVLAEMKQVADVLAKFGYTLQSGHAIGADRAFESGSDKNKIFLPEQDKNQKDNEYYIGSDKLKNLDVAKEIINVTHPAAKRLKKYIYNLQVRNIYQVFGENLDTPVDFVLAWTPLNANGEVVTSHEQVHYDKNTPDQNTGGTGLAITIASRKGIPVINLADKNWKSQLEEVLSKKGIIDNNEKTGDSTLDKLKKKFKKKLIVAVDDNVNEEKATTPENNKSTNNNSKNSSKSFFSKNKNTNNKEIIDRKAGKYREKVGDSGFRIGDIVSFDMNGKTITAVITDKNEKGTSVYLSYLNGKPLKTKDGKHFYKNVKTLTNVQTKNGTNRFVPYVLHVAGKNRAKSRYFYMEGYDNNTEKLFTKNKVITSLNKTGKAILDKLKHKPEKTQTEYQENSNINKIKQQIKTYSGNIESIGKNDLNIVQGRNTKNAFNQGDVVMSISGNGKTTYTVEFVDENGYMILKNNKTGTIYKDKKANPKNYQIVEGAYEVASEPVVKQTITTESNGFTWGKAPADVEEAFKATDDKASVAQKLSDKTKKKLEDIKNKIERC